MNDDHLHTCPFGPGRARELCSADCGYGRCSGKIDPEIAAAYDVPPDQLHTIDPEAYDLVVPADPETEPVPSAAAGWYVATDGGYTSDPAQAKHREVDEKQPRPAPGRTEPRPAAPSGRDLPRQVRRQVVETVRFADHEEPLL